MTYRYWRKDWENWPPSYEEKVDYINTQVRKNKEKKVKRST
jgi:hypothetical protein